MDKNLNGPDTTGMEEEIDLERLELLDRLADIVARTDVPVLYDASHVAPDET